jgi:hypothetical protein
VILTPRCSEGRAVRAFGLQTALRLAVALLMVGLTGCYSITAPAPHGVGFRSFLGIDFGASLRETRRYYPTGLNEASPLGYPAYHVTDLSSEGVSYPDVIYEFDGTNGMQVVIARFAPTSADAVLERLRRILGEPTQHTLTEDQRMSDALWLTPGGEEVRFDRTHRLMVVIGPQGANLKKDVDLRLENSATIL